MSYAFSRAVDIDSGEQLKNVPRHLITGAASVNLPGAIGAYVRYNHTWGAFLDDGDVYPLEGRSTVDLRLRRPLGRQAVFVDVLNASNRRSVEGTLYNYDFSQREQFRGLPVIPTLGLKGSF